MVDPNQSKISEGEELKPYAELHESLSAQTLGYSHRQDLQESTAVRSSKNPDVERTYRRVISTIDQMSAKELQQAEKLWKDEFYANVNTSPGEIIRSYLDNSRVGLLIFALNDLGEMIGISTISLKTTRGKGMGMLKKTQLAVVELGDTTTRIDYRRQGIGRALTELRLNNTQLVVDLAHTIPREIIEAQLAEDQQKDKGAFTYEDFIEAIDGESAILRTSVKDPDHSKRIADSAAVLGFGENKGSRKFLKRKLLQIVVMKRAGNMTTLRITVDQPHNGQSLFTRYDFTLVSETSFTDAQKIASAVAVAAHAVPAPESTNTTQIVYKGTDLQGISGQIAVLTEEMSSPTVIEAPTVAWGLKKKQTT